MKIAFIIRDLGHGGAQRQLVLLAIGLVKDCLLYTSRCV